VPGTHSHPKELVGIARGMAEAGSSVFQLISDSLGKEPDCRWMNEIGEITGQPIIFSMVDVRADADPCEFRAAVPWRPPGFLMASQSSLHLFSHHKAFAEIADLPLEANVERMRDPAFRRALFANGPDITKSLTGLVSRFDKMYSLDVDLD
jgi:N-acyl-D-aspartate/D-glutamate deacylase